AARRDRRPGDARLRDKRRGRAVAGATRDTPGRRKADRPRQNSARRSPRQAVPHAHRVRRLHVRRLPWDAGPPELWRLDTQAHAATWDSGKGAELAGGRWNPEGLATVYCSADPSTAILELAVHKGFGVLDRVPHILTLAVLETQDVHVVRDSDVPNAHWLSPAPPSQDQQLFGKSLLEANTFVLLPSAV